MAYKLPENAVDLTATTARITAVETQSTSTKTTADTNTASVATIQAAIDAAKRDNINNVLYSTMAARLDANLSSLGTSIGTNTSQISTVAASALANATAIASVASGSPKGQYATLAALTAAIPAGNTNIYLVLADGKWYYWNSSAWTAGGTYQSTGIGVGTVTRAGLETDIQSKLVPLPQLANTIYMFNNVNAITLVNSNTVEFTTTSTSGEMGFTVPNVNGNVYKVVATVTNIGAVDAATTRMVVGYNSSPGANAAAASNGATPTASATLAVGNSVTWDVEVTTANAATGAAFTVMTGTSGAQLRYTQRVFNITGLDAQVKATINWATVPTYTVVAELAKRAYTADLATTATYANDGPFSKNISIFPNLFGDFATKVVGDFGNVSITGFAISAGIASGTPSTASGSILLYNQPAGVTIGKKYLFTALVKADSAMQVKGMTYQYQDTTQLDGGAALAGPTVDIDTNWKRISFVATLDRTNVNRVRAGIGNVTPTSGFIKFYVKSMMMIDVSSSLLADADIELFGGYWATTPIAVAAAQAAQTASLAAYASDGPFAKPVAKYTNLSGDFSTKLSTSFNNPSITGFSISGGIASGTASSATGSMMTYIGGLGATNGKTFLLTMMVKTDVATQVKPQVYRFTGVGGTNLGSIVGSTINVDTNWTRLTYVFTINITAVDTLLSGVLIAGTLTKMYIKEMVLLDITTDVLDEAGVVSLGGYWVLYPNLVPNAQYALVAQKSLDSSSPWSGKKVLAIGDSLTAANKWQTTVASKHGVTITTHALGGIGITHMVDGTTNGNGTIAALTQAQVADKDLIIFYGGTNDRTYVYGNQGDVSTTTIWGRMQYVIDRIYTLLAAAGNLKCKLLFVTPHCAGKYNSIDADGYQEYPAGSGLTMEKLSTTIKTAVHYNNCQCVDLWHDSGIGKNTWAIYAANPVQNPTPPNVDQLHLSDLGYARVGEVIAARISTL